MRSNSLNGWGLHYEHGLNCTAGPFPENDCHDDRQPPKMAGMHHALMIAVRVLAGIIGAIAFYFAFFLYEDDEGRWQNRIEALWISVHDRAQTTHSTSTALLNEFGDTLGELFDALFGQKLLSFRAFSTSLLLSMVFALPIQLLEMSIVTPKERLAYIAAFFVGEYYLLAGIWELHKTPTSVFLFFASLYGCVAFYFYVALILDYDFSLGKFWTWVGLSLGSVLVGYLILIIIRRLIFMFSRTISLFLLAASMLALICLTFVVSISLLFCVFRSSYTRFLSIFHANNNLRLYDWLDVAFPTALPNMSTALLSLLPLSMIAVILFHRIAWPILSHLLYPIASRKIVTNRRILLPLGILSFSFAFGLGGISSKELFKLLGL
jgi:hypothetical protein